MYYISYIIFIFNKLEWIDTESDRIAVHNLYTIPNVKGLTQQQTFQTKLGLGRKEFKEQKKVVDLKKKSDKENKKKDNNNNKNNKNKVKK